MNKNKLQDSDLINVATKFAIKLAQFQIKSVEKIFDPIVLTKEKLEKEIETYHKNHLPEELSVVSNIGIKNEISHLAKEGFIILIISSSYTCQPTFQEWGVEEGKVIFSVKLVIDIDLIKYLDSVRIYTTK